MYMYHSLIFNCMRKRLFHRLHTKNSSQETTKDRPKTLNQGWHTYFIPRLACTPQPRLISLPLIYWLNWTQQISISFKSYQYTDFVMLLMITNTGFHSWAKKSYSFIIDNNYCTPFVIIVMWDKLSLSSNILLFW